MPKGRLGKIGNALFDAFSGDMDLLTSTLIGVMMGFLPTVDGNMRGALYEWVNEPLAVGPSDRLSGRRRRGLP